MRRGFGPLGAAFAGAAVVVLAIFAASRARSEQRCGPGFEVVRARCMPAGGACPAPLVMTSRGCDAPDTRVNVGATKLTLGPSDWEAQGRVTPRTVVVSAFAIDAFEVTVAKLAASLPTEVAGDADGARAAAGVAYDVAARFCAARGGRLPTEDEWIVAAAGERGTRYPWGDTGAVCRRAAWGLSEGPCERSADGADTVGAHPSGDTPTGIHDLAGNVAEWVQSARESEVGIVRGGSWRTSLASELRTWARREMRKERRADDVGFRCAYDR